MAGVEGYHSRLDFTMLINIILHPLASFSVKMNPRGRNSVAKYPLSYQHRKFTTVNLSGEMNYV